MACFAFKYLFEVKRCSRKKDASSSEAVILILCLPLPTPPLIHSVPFSDPLCALEKLIPTNSITGALLLAGFYFLPLVSSNIRRRLEGWKTGKDRREARKESPYVYPPFPTLPDLPHCGSSLVKVLVLWPIFHGSILSVNYNNIILSPYPFRTKDGSGFLL